MNAGKIISLLSWGVGCQFVLFLMMMYLIFYVYARLEPLKKLGIFWVLITATGIAFVANVVPIVVYLIDPPRPEE